MQAGSELTALKLKSDDERQTIQNTRLANLLENNKKRYIEAKQIYNSQESKSNCNCFVKTRFSSSKNYLWERCNYFSQSEEYFYVKIFLDTGKFLVGHQVFVEKLNQVYYLFLNHLFFLFFNF